MSDLYQRHTQEQVEELKKAYASQQAEHDNFVQDAVETMTALDSRIKKLELQPKSSVDYLIWIAAFVLLAYVIFTISLGVFVWTRP